MSKENSTFVKNEVGPETNAAQRKWFDRTSLAEHFGISVRLLDQWVKYRRIRVIRVGRRRLFNIDDVTEDLKRFEVRAIGQ